MKTLSTGRNENQEYKYKMLIFFFHPVKNVRPNYILSRNYISKIQRFN